MRPSQAFWLSSAIGRSLASPYLAIDVCPWTPLQALDLVSLPPPVDHTSLYNAGQPNNTWIGPHLCIGRYCVWTNGGFSGRGASIVTTRENGQRLVDSPALEAAMNDDAASFNTTHVPGKGIGMVARRKIRRGEQILGSPAALLIHRQLVDELLPEDQHRLFEVAVAGLPKARQHQFMGLAAELGGHIIEDIMNTNSFQTKLGGPDGRHIAIFPEAARYNHDCRPNVAFYIDENLIHRSHAIRDILPGEELAISYLDSFRARTVRQARTQHSWGFSCTCSQCSLPQSEADASDARLYSIYKVENQLADLSNTNVTPSMIEELIDLYKEERVHFKLAEAYTIAALNYNLFGLKEQTRKYAELAIEQGLLEHGPHASDVATMRGLVREPEAHWTYNRRPYNEKEHGKLE